MPAAVRGLILPALLVIAGCAVLVSLGNWQLRRLAWKDALIERVQERLIAQPIDLRSGDPAELSEDSSFLDQNEYRPALLSGRYDAGGEVLVFTSLSDPKGPAAGPGFWVFTPLITPRGAAVYVNRGFVPQGRKRDYAPPPAGEVVARGPLRPVEPGSWLTPKPDLQGRVFFARNPIEIARATGIDAPVARFFIDLDASQTPPSGLPQAGETRTRFPNNHLQYALTWYGLAAALLAVFASFAWTRLRDHADPPGFVPRP